MATFRSRQRIRFNGFSPFVAFLLVASFGLLFGCKGPEAPEEFVFTEKDAARFRELADQAMGGSGVNLTSSGSGAAMGSEPYLMPLSGTGTTVGPDGVPVLDLSMLPTYRAIRTGGTAVAGNIYRVTNEFLNVRSKPSAGGPSLERLTRGDIVDVIEFVNAGWAHVKTVVGKTDGYVATQYIARITSDEKLAEEKKKFEGMYYVNFGFVNVRAAADQKAEKIGEIPGQTIVKPLSISGPWARISFNGKDGYVSTGYLAPFLPRFLVRQEKYELPALMYSLDQSGAIDAIVANTARLKQEGYTIITFRDFHDFLVRQEAQNITLQSKQVMLGVTGVTAANVRELSDTLMENNIRATFFIRTKDIGLSGITEKMLITLGANGFDIESAGQSGDDLRAMTNAQVEMELRQSRQILEAYTHRSIIAISYPQGGVNDRVAQMAQEAGYLLGVTNTPDRTFTRDQLLRLPSFLVFPSMSADEVLKTVKGS